ncbi:hypothetical protein SAMN02927930_01191 [Pseudidiomarina indica]|uniref:Uncharacterized protein n=1 Tax=Pseudidiomarina indica TaxID=1159017 RepID=A0A1G6CBX5_9GAMM|nr:hypothetical protein [Pseudidiomarina indica]SDB30388.1 hypothetical protein SAMN02927930_01191 [Pseudidiomarina indica]
MAQPHTFELLVSWDEFHRTTRELARRLLPAEQWQGNDSASGTARHLMA